MTDEVRRASTDLMEVADRLIRDYDQVATGSILRCLSRAVRQVRRTGCPLDKLPSQAETTARTMLDYRINDASRERPAAPVPPLRLAAATPSWPAGPRPPSSSPSPRRTG